MKPSTQVAILTDSTSRPPVYHRIIYSGYRSRWVTSCGHHVPDWRPKIRLEWARFFGRACSHCTWPKNQPPRPQPLTTHMRWRLA